MKKATIATLATVIVALSFSSCKKDVLDSRDAVKAAGFRTAVPPTKGPGIFWPDTVKVK